MCAYHHPDHCACTSNSLPCALSAFCLYPAPSCEHSRACELCLGCLQLQSKAADTLLTTWNPLTLSLGEVCPAQQSGPRRAETKALSSLLHQTQQITALHSGTSVQEIPLLEHRGFAGRVEGKKEKTWERAGLEDRFCLL